MTPRFRLYYCLTSVALNLALTANALRLGYWWVAGCHVAVTGFFCLMLGGRIVR